MKISVPFCFLPNSNAQEFDLETSFRSRFQIQQIKEVSERPDFAYFVCMLHENSSWIMYDREECCRCPVVVTWYDKAGQCWSGRVGMKKFMDGHTTWRKVSGTYPPVPLDHCVYTSRCK